MGKKTQTGERYGRLTTVEFFERRGQSFYWRCLCDCGAEKVVASGKLRSGNTKSCGCYRRETSGQKNFIHGHKKGTRTLGAYRHAKERCLNPNNADYPNYGGRGIEMCAIWMQSFKAFLDDMGEAPAGMTLDRIDGDKGYEPSNCRWATPRLQALNRRSTYKIFHKGETMSLRKFAEVEGLYYPKLAKAYLTSGHDLTRSVAIAKTHVARSMD